ncbi:iron-containing alcohol dehydrogenase family protein [filamentous cyanobacterium LEGE 11480]|uniref:Iron-containing alcohol dehydrogenase family protein n=1 Tax=Romeriopsis navalis LEGE 11480 TaxID=2777977 RepID=A0A928Z6E0_9CYAN|nr:iron-containing alcohol dehydrogenase family protein [Romeriopsis navalis]MBE9032927.1 iron-containing alcohol dehydrogenase family protein [Romeriopsis navalis LEGE 11480]
MVKTAMTGETPLLDSLTTLAIAPARVMRGRGILEPVSEAIARIGQQPLVIGGDRSLPLIESALLPHLASRGLAVGQGCYGADCSERATRNLQQVAQQHGADVIIAVGGGKAMDTGKLVAHQLDLPIVTIPTSGATCAAWTALSNIYSEQGAFQYDVALPTCPELLVLDYDLIATAPQRTLVAGIGDAIAKWYEASVSSGQSERTLLINAVQQARVLRDILFQKSVAALANPGTPVWCDVVDATVLMAGVTGGIGGAQCRTVAAHAVHNGLTQLSASHDMLHGEKVAYGILVQLRLEEMLQGNQLASSSRQQLIKFYRAIGLPRTLTDLGLADCTIAQLHQVAEVACQPQSDIHRLPFDVTPVQLLAAMVSTTAPVAVASGLNESEIAASSS